MATSTVSGLAKPDNPSEKEKNERNPSVNFAQVRSDENDEIEQLSVNRGVESDLNESREGGAPPARLAVAFSGGGIRSAAVNLGVIQALAKAGILRQVHYLSGISGGGYTLGWLTSWIRRSGFADVEKQLQSGVAADRESRDSGSDGHLSWVRQAWNWVKQLFRKPKTVPVSPPVAIQTASDKSACYRYLEPNPIRYLRQYASYLTPRMGLASGDTLAMISIYLRNVLLNQTMMICLLAAIVAALHLLAPGILWKTSLTALGQGISFGIGLISAAVAGYLVGTSLGRLGNDQNPKEWEKAGLTAAILTAIVAVCLWILLPMWRYCNAVWVAGALVFVTYMVGWLRDSYTERESSRAGKAGLSAVSSDCWPTVLAFVAAIAVVIVGGWGIQRWLSVDGWICVGDWYAMLGLPAILVLFSLSSYVDIGIAGNALPDAKREWLGRLSGYYLYFAAIAAIVMIGALRGPLWMPLLFREASSATGGGKWWKWVLPGGWVFTVVSGLLAAKSPKTEEPGTQGRVLNILAKVAPPVFLAGVFLLVSWAVHVITQLADAAEYLTSADSYSCRLILTLLAVIGGAGTISGVLMGRLDANEFSMHLFYRNRLVRAFLGASNVRHDHARGRVPSPFTGFALDDDVPLQELSSHWSRAIHCYHNESVYLTAPRPAKVPDETGADAKVAKTKLPDCYDGPYPIWGTALNLTTGEDLAWQQRKAASFIYSPLYCGWDHVSPQPQQWEKPDADSGFRDTEASRLAEGDDCKYAYRGTGSFMSDGRIRTPYTKRRCGPSVGTAMAASGAAISPNWGYHTSPAVAALLALFNIRIGWWTGNPRRRTSWCRYAPGAYYLITKELFGRADDASTYVYLSDGGHFDNLGIYEMVRRRMKYIIACDADADPDYRFEDLAKAVEKCRRDFGVEIEIDPSPIRPQAASKLSQRHFAVGTINYPSAAPDGKGAEKGILLYLKSSLTGSEPADVLGERNGSRFPHDTTANQFFNETRFEAYRGLGEHMLTGIWMEFITEGGHSRLPKEKSELVTRVNGFFKYLEKQYTGNPG